MKRLLVIIKILFFTSVGLFGHPSGGFLDYFHYRPAFEFFKEPLANKQGADGLNVYILTLQKFKAVIDNSVILKKYQKFMNYLKKHTYSFNNYRKFHMLSSGEDNHHLPVRLQLTYITKQQLLNSNFWCLYQ